MNNKQTKPVRSLGADITQATLQQTLDRLDISSQVAQLTYAEKRLLIMISLTQQLSGVTNDWGRTLESPSNQIRIMNEQWQRLTRSVGNLFMGMISKVLPYLNAILMVLTEIVSSVATLLGYKIDDFDFFDEAAVTGVEDFGDSLNSAAESAKKLKQGLRGFDKLNVITTPSETSSGVGAGAGGINPKLMDAFNSAFDEYQRKLDNVEMKATKIRDKIMEWLGFTKQVDEETGDVSFKFDHITGGTVLGALAIGGSIYRGINFILKMLNKIGLIKFTNLKDVFSLFTKGTIQTKVTGLSGAFTSLASTLGISTAALAGIVVAITAVGAALVYAYTKSEEFRNKVNEAFGSVFELAKDIYEVISTKTQEMWVIVEPIWNMFKDTVVLALTTFYDTVVWVFSDAADIISGTAKIISDLIHGDFSGAFDDFVDMIENIWKNWDDYFGKIGDNFDKWIEDFQEDLEDFIPKAIDKFGELLTWISELPNKFGEFAGEAVTKLWDKITETDWLQLGKDVINAILKGLSWKQNMFNNFGTDLYNAITKSLSKIDWAKIGLDILKAITSGMAWKQNLLNGFADGFVDGIKKALKIHSPSKLIIDNKIGDYAFEGITFGMDKQIPTLKEQAKDIVDTLNSGIKEASLDYDFNYNIPRFNSSSMDFNTASSSIGTNSNTKTTFNPTFIIQVGNKEIAKQVITDLQDMAIDNGKPITIGG